MKLIVTILLTILFCSCGAVDNDVLSLNPENPKELNEQRDTSVLSKVVPAQFLSPNYFAREYFVVIGNDTSDYSCVVSQNKKNGKISLAYNYTPYNKFSESFSLADSAAVVEKQQEQKKFLTLDYDGQIRELNLIMDIASKDFNLKKLEVIRLSMRTIMGFSEDITKQFIKRFGKTIDYKSNPKVASLIGASQLTADLNRILSQYSLKIAKCSIDGLVYYKPVDRVQNKSTNKENAILDGIVYFNIIRQ